jgi:hypothetical protein
MEKRGIVDSHTPDVADKLAKRASAMTPAAKVAALDDDTTNRLAAKAAEQLKKRSQQ